MKPILFHSEATAELEEAVGFYESRRPGLGRAFLDEVEHGTKRIQDHPGIGAPYKETELRHYILRRFPYALFHLELPEVIWIAAVAHGKRRPGYWKHRTVEQAEPNGTEP